MTLYQIIKALQDAPTKGGGKKAVLQAHKDNALLKQYLKAVYDPRINYYITKLPKPATPMFDYTYPFNEDDVADMVAVIGGREITGSAAKAMIAAKLAKLDDEGKELLGYIIGRDIRAGVGEGSVLEAFPGLFYIPPYQRCASMTEERKERFGKMPFFYVQTKSDGQFCYAINRRSLGMAFEGHGKERQAMTRAGSIHPEWLANQITRGIPEGHVAMGELLVYRYATLLDRKTGNGILNSILTGDGSKFSATTDEVHFVAWDMVTEEEFEAGKSEREYDDRWEFLTYCTTLDTIPSWKVKSVKEANRIQTEHTARGEEGTVWKSPEMGWRDCQSGDKDMMKAKTVFEAEYKITGAYEGEGKAAGMLGGFNLATSDDLIEFNCGSGYSDLQRKEYWSILQQNPDAFKGTIVTAEGNDIVTSKSKPGKEAVFLPIFVEIRFDKFEADSRARVWEQFEAAKLGKLA